MEKHLTRLDLENISIQNQKIDFWLKNDPNLGSRTKNVCLID